jgi:hypothetical protein
MDAEQPTWGVSLPCCALCGRPLGSDPGCWVVLNQGLGFSVCSDLEGCEPLRRLVRAHPERFLLGAGWPSRARPLRVWPGRVRAVARSEGFDEAYSWRLTLDVRVTTVGGARQVRAFAYTFPAWTGDPRTGSAYAAVLGRPPAADETLRPAEWAGRRCGVVLDWSRDERGRQVVWVAELRGGRTAEARRRDGGTLAETGG